MTDEVFVQVPLDRGAHKAIQTLLTALADHTGEKVERVEAKYLDVLIGITIESTQGVK